MLSSIKRLAYSAALAASLALPHAAHAAYPDKPVTLIVPWAAGGSTDILARTLSEHLTQAMGQTFVVENRSGASGNIGSAYVARAQPDGYTLLVGSMSTHTMNKALYSTMPFDGVKDFTPIAELALVTNTMVINPSVPASNVAEFIAYAKANPGKMTFAVGSIGSAGHLSTELLKRAGNLEYLIVPYKGTAPAFNNLIGGQIDGFIDPILGSLQYYKSGMLKVVAVTSAARAPNLPEVPTVAETIPGYEFYSWYGLWGPAKLPPDIATRLNTEVNKALSTDMRDRLVEQGLLLTPGSAADFAKFQHEDMARSQKIVTEGNIRVEQ